MALTYQRGVHMGQEFRIKGANVSDEISPINSPYSVAIHACTRFFVPNRTLTHQQ